MIYLILNGELIPDPLYPIGEGINRDEYFLINFDDICHSTGESITYSLMKLNRFEDFPRLNDFKTMEELDIFFNVTPFGKYDVLEYLAKKSLDKEYMDNILKECFSTNTYNIQHLTRMMNALVNISYTSYLKEMYLVFDREIYPHDVFFINTYFHKNIDKILVSDSPMEDLIKENDKFTTIYTSDIAFLWSLVADKEDHRCDNMAFVLCNNTTNMDVIVDPNDGRMSTKEIMNDDFYEMRKHTNFTFGRFHHEPYIQPPEPSMNIDIPEGELKYE